MRPKQMITRALAGSVLAVVLAASPAAAGTSVYDTNGDRVIDLKVHTDRNAAGDIVRMHFDGDGDGVVDPGDIEVKCQRINAIQVQRVGKSRRFTFQCHHGQGHVELFDITVSDRNGDGDTADKAEIGATR